MKQKKLDESEKANVIFASYSMAAEGLDIPKLNTLIMMTPRKSIEQSIGRITRKKDHPVQPTIIDIVDQLPSLNNQYYQRKKFYDNKTFQMKLYQVEEDVIINEVSIKQNDINKIISKCEFID